MPKTPPPPYPGRCLCGKVRFELIGEPLTYYVCHCTVCQRRTGGAALPVMWVRRADLVVRGGAPALRVFDMSNGGERRARVCVDCDTRLWAEPRDKPDIAQLRPGMLDDQSSFRPIAHIFTRNRQPWLLLPPDVAQFEGGPDEPGQLLRLWQEASTSS